MIHLSQSLSRSRWTTACPRTDGQDRRARRATDGAAIPSPSPAEPDKSCVGDVPSHFFQSLAMHDQSAVEDMIDEERGEGASSI